MFYRIGNLVVRSPVSIRKPRKGEDCLVLKTSRSFPPAHPSTRAALEVLDRLEPKVKSRVLDLGCGSGVLGLAAAVKNKTNTVACDINPAAITASIQNANFSSLSDRLLLFRGSADAIRGRFDLVLANLPMAVHEEMFTHYRRLTTPNKSVLVVSGFCDVNAARMQKELEQNGFEVLERVVVNAWAAAITDEYTYTWIGFGLKRV